MKKIGYYKIIIFSVLLGSLLLDPRPLCSKTLYKWMDSKGEVHVTDIPPNNDAEGTLLEEIEMKDRAGQGIWKWRASRKIVNPEEGTSLNRLSAWMSSPEMKLFELQSARMMTVVFGAAIFLNLFYSLCLYLIARKVGLRIAWLAWIPVANFFPLAGSAGLSPWWGILFVLPSLASIPQVGMNTVLVLVLCLNLWVSGWFGLLVLIPPFFFILLGYLAFREESEELSVPRLRPAVITLVLCLALTASFHVAFKKVWMPWWNELVQQEMSSFLESSASMSSPVNPFTPAGTPAKNNP
jgi:hypothetical protein